MAQMPPFFSVLLVSIQTILVWGKCKQWKRKAYFGHPSPRHQVVHGSMEESVSPTSPICLLQVGLHLCWFKYIKWYNAVYNQSLSSLGVNCDMNCGFCLLELEQWAMGKQLDSALLGITHCQCFVAMQWFTSKVLMVTQEQNMNKYWRKWRTSRGWTLMTYFHVHRIAGFLTKHLKY